jgi:aspartate/methionine/tyrosine aminotransferase
MPKISKKGELMPPSPIRKLVPFATEAKKRGVKVIHLNIGQPDIETPHVVRDAIKNFDYKVLSYLNSEGSEKYRLKLVDYYKLNVKEFETLSPKNTYTHYMGDKKLTAYFIPTDKILTFNQTFI